MLFRMRREMANEEPLIIPEIDRLILIDRECDLVTPCISQLTYEGMVDEVFGIYNSTYPPDGMERQGARITLCVG